MNYISSGWRTGYFPPTDRQEADQFARRWQVKLVERIYPADDPTDVRDRWIAFLCDEGDYPPSLDEDLLSPDEERPDNEEDLFLVELSALIPPDWAVVLMEAGGEGMRYLNGFACVITSEGVIDSVHLTDIYQKIAPGVKYTECSY